MCLERMTEGWVGVDGTDGGGKTVPYVGAGNWEGRLPNCVLLRLTAAARVVEERSWRTFESAEANTTRSERYDGHIHVILCLLSHFNTAQIQHVLTMIHTFLCAIHKSPRHFPGLPELLGNDSGVSRQTFADIVIFIGLMPSKQHQRNENNTTLYY